MALRHLASASASAAAAASARSPVAVTRTCIAATAPPTAQARLAARGLALRVPPRSPLTTNNKPPATGEGSLAGRVQKKSTITTDGAASMEADAALAEAGAAAKAANSGSGSGSKATAGKTSFAAWYESWLEKAPVVTKMVSGSILWGLGDVVAQVSVHSRRVTPVAPHSEF